MFGNMFSNWLKLITDELVHPAIWTAGAGYLGDIGTFLFWRLGRDGGDWVLGKIRRPERLGKAKFCMF